MTAGWARLLDDGRVALPEALASVDEVTRSSGDRALVVRVAGGLGVDVLPDRGLDLGAAWWRGVPIAWRSPHLGDPGPARGWEDRFLGGLLATCGPDNIGSPRGGAGQHGTHHLTPAHDVRWWRERADAEDDGGAEIDVHVAGSVGHTTLYGARVVVDREVVVATGRPWVEVRDVVRNVGDAPVGVPLLYHVNLGGAALVPGSRLLVDADEPVPAEPLPDGRDAVTFPEPARAAGYVVAEHPGVRSAGGRARAVVAPTGLGAAVGEEAGGGPEIVVEWSSATMPRLYSWLWPARGAWVLGVEPANAPLVGPERDLPHGGAPVLAPGESWACGVRVGVRTSTEPGR
ncbi:aldose 1-epimerase family protein [Isoptericola hypogeus]|uniref:Aldose 1-epimerase family protein n=1 Tax=Isoptericola hypogeus TaxID=300179 RepID=A0ABP4VTC2_9MICO